MNNLKTIAAVSAALVVLAGVGIFHTRPVHAASGRNLTAQIAQLGIGLVVVDQQTGALSFCADQIGYYITKGVSGPWQPTGKCAKLGTTTPNSSLPTAAVGLSVIIPSASNVATNATDGASFYVVNNQTGDIVQCNTINGGGTPQGVCVDLGIAPQ